APVVPEHKIARPPVMAPGQGVVGGDGPDVVQQRLGFLLRDALEVCIPPATEIETSSARFRMLADAQALCVCLRPATEIEPSSARFRMLADERVQCPRRVTRVLGRRKALPKIAAAVVGAVVLDS